MKDILNLPEPQYTKVFREIMVRMDKKNTTFHFFIRKLIRIFVAEN